MSTRRPTWFIIRQELSPRKRLGLSILSFVLPIFLWVLVSYVPPFAWHPDIKLQISADQKGVRTVYTAGDRVGREYFPEFQQNIINENAQVKSASDSGEPIASTKRANLKILRHMSAVGISNGWLTDDQKENDAAIFEIWKGLAEGSLESKTVSLSPQNVDVIAYNWNLLKSSTTYDYAQLPEQQLLKLVPEGNPSNPVYLPAPHEVVFAGFADFTQPPSGDKPWMYERMGHSLTIVFGGFLLSCIFGIPLGILCGTYDFFSRLFEPFIDFFRYMPAPAFSTLLVAIFAAHDMPKVALVFIGTFFQMVLVISNTTRLLDRSLLEAAQTLGANNLQLIWKVIVPGILPNLYNDLRILLGWSWTWLVIAELVGVKTGLTEFIETQGRWRNFDRVFPVIISIGIMGFATDHILNWFRAYLFPWTGKPSSKGLVSQIIRFISFKPNKASS